MITPAYAPTATERVLPRLALDFTTGVLDPRVTVTRALNTATRVNSSGSVEVVNTDLPRFDYDFLTLAPKGLLIEETRANLLINNTAVGAVVGSPGTPPTHWNIVPAGLSSQIVAVGAEKGVDYVDIRFFGTLTGSNFLVRLQVSGSNVTTGANQPTTFSSYLKIVAGSLANITTSRFVWDEFNSGGGYVTSASMNTTIDATLTRRTGTATTAATTSRINPYIQFLSSVGAAIDITIRFGLPQIELGSSATSVIKTSLASLTRNADVVSVTGTNFSSWWQATTGGLLVRARQSVITGTRPWVHISDGTADNIISLRGNAANPELYIKATADQTQIDAGTLVANTSYGMVGAWDTNNCAAAINGGAAVTDTSAAIPTVDRMLIGSDGTNYLNGWAEKIAFWPQRIINAEVQAFSK